MCVCVCVRVRVCTRNLLVAGPLDNAGPGTRILLAYSRRAFLAQTGEGHGPLWLCAVVYQCSNWVSGPKARTGHQDFWKA